VTNQAKETATGKDWLLVADLVYVGTTHNISQKNN